MTLFACLFWFLAHSDQGPVAVFSSNEHSEIFKPVWSFWHRAPNGWVFVISGDRREAEGLSIWSWPTGQQPKRLINSGIREGIFQVRGSALTPSGKKLYLRGFTNPVLFEVNLENPKRFKRAFLVEQSDSILFWDEKRLLSGGKYPKLVFKVYGEDQNPIPLLANIKDQIPSDIDHPIEHFYGQNQMLMAKNGQKLAIAFGLYSEVMIWDGVRKRYFVIGFPGYQKPPWKNPRNIKRFKPWFEKLHHLSQLTWFQDRLFGLFKQGYEEYGVWVEFVGAGAIKIWDNDKEDIRIFAMEKDSLILGKQILDHEEEVQWQLWQASSLPSR